jgi:four helix bundle protein
MKYKRFEELPVWRCAQELALQVYGFTEDPALSGSGDLRDQLRRAALSISNNIAEGFERGSTTELLQFLYIARGSAAELRSMLLFAERLPQTTNLKSNISNLKSLAENCSRQIRGWADSLQDTDIRGHRHLNSQTRKGYEQKRAADEFNKQLDDLRQRAESERNKKSDL